MPENNEMMNVAATVATETVEKADNKGTILMAAGFVSGIAITCVAVKGAKVVRKKISDRKAKKENPVVVADVK